MKLNILFTLMLAVILLGIICTVLHVEKMHYGEVKPSHPPNRATSPSRLADICENCEKEILKVLDIYSEIWTKNEDNHRQLKSELSFKCNGFDDAIITQANTPLASVLVYDGDTTTLNVTEEVYSTFAKTHPFSNKSLDTCAVVGNGGILTNSSCGDAIDSAHFVIRCNMPPLEGKFAKDVGIKSDIVTANPSIVVEKYGRLLNRRRPFVDHARLYGNAMLLAPTFCYSHNTRVILRAFYTVEDFELQVQPASMNPRYLKNLDRFWRSRGLNPTKRLTTGFMMTSLALEICDNVHLYGFWPFDRQAHTNRPLSHHYYDDRPPKPGAHSVSAEFELLLKLHRKGVLKLHLGQCPPLRSVFFT